MQEEKNPFSVGIPILLAIAAIFAVGKLLMGDGRHRSEPTRPKPAAPHLVDVVAATQGSMSPPQELARLGHPIKVTGEDAAVIWLKWSDSTLRADKLVDEAGGAYSIEIQPQKDLVAVIIKRGYAKVPKQLMLTTVQTGMTGSVASGAINVPTEELPAPVALLPASPPNVKVRSWLVRSPTNYRAPFSIHLSIEPDHPSTTFAKVTPMRASYVKGDHPDARSIFRVVNGRLEGEVYVPNGQYTRDLEVEIEELSDKREVQDIEFKSAQMMRISTRTASVYNLPAIDGPSGSKWRLLSAYAQGKGTNKHGVPTGWVYVDVDCELEKNPEDVAVDFGPLVRCTILAPSAKELGVGRFDCKFVINNEHRSGRAHWIDGAAVVPGPEIAAKHAPDSLLLRVSVQHLSRLTKKTMIAPIDTKKVVEQKGMYHMST